MSSSPLEVVEPLGEFLGADEVDRDPRPTSTTTGNYTGELEFYAYGADKADAMREIAAREGIDLAAVVRVQRLDHRPADARGSSGTPSP